MAVEFDWIDVPAGTFEMGSASSAARDNEKPVHRIQMSAFRMAHSPVTRSQYQEFLDATDHEPPPFWTEEAFSDPQAPAVGPSWDDAQSFCQWHEQQTGEAIGLPTEAQWEYASTDGRETLYPWGDGGVEAVPDYEQRWIDGPESIDAYPSPHPRGFVGLCENIHEWCDDWYSAEYYEVSEDIDPRGPEEGRKKSSRGGAWRHAIKISRCAARSAILPHCRYSDYGFRVCLLKQTS